MALPDIHPAPNPIELCERSVTYAQAWLYSQSREVRKQVGPNTAFDLHVSHADIAKALSIASYRLNIAVIADEQLKPGEWYMGWDASESKIGTVGVGT